MYVMVVEMATKLLTIHTLYGQHTTLLTQQAILHHLFVLQTETEFIKATSKKTMLTILQERCHCFQFEEQRQKVDCGEELH